MRTYRFHELCVEVGVQLRLVDQLVIGIRILDLNSKETFG